MKKQNKKKKYLVAASALGLLALAAGTFAWFTSEDKAKNHFEGQLAANDIVITETYVPEKDWEPGEEVKKEVAVSNLSEYDSFIRVSFEEALLLLENNNEIRYNGTTYVREGAELAETPTDLIAVPSPTDYVATGYKAITLENAPANITVEGVEYSFKMYAKQTPENPTETDTIETTYVGQWENAAGDKAKAYIANLSSVVAYDRAAGTYTLTDEANVQISLVSKKYAAEKTASWPTDVMTNSPVIAGELEKFNGIVEAPDRFNIQLLFAGNLAATPTQDKWFYNEADGYFYYCAIVPGGGATAQLLDAVKLNEQAGNDYSLMQYDLTVLAEGLQAVKGASVDAWNVTGALETFLEGLV